MSEVVFKSRFKSQKHGSKKNRKKIFKNFKTGRLFIGSEAKTKELESILIDKLRIEKLKNRLDTITFDVNAKIIFYFPASVYFTKKGHRSNKVADQSNLYQSVEDALQKAKVIHNDSQICGHDGSRRKPCEGTDYWLEIELTKFVE